MCHFCEVPVLLHQVNWETGRRKRQHLLFLSCIMSELRSLIDSLYMRHSQGDRSKQWRFGIGERKRMIFETPLAYNYMGMTYRHRRVDHR